MGSKLELRNKDFMQSIDFDVQRKQREDFSIEIRKQNRSDHAAKRRILSQEEGDSDSSAQPGPVQFRLSWVPRELISLFPVLGNDDLNNKQRLEILRGVLRECLDPKVILMVLRGIRHSTSRRGDRPIDELVALDYLPGLANFTTHQNSDIVSEASWIICNIASDTSENTYAVVTSGALASCHALLSSDISDILEHAIWTFGNVAGDSIALRDLLLSMHVHLRFMEILNSLSLDHYGKVLRVSAWSLCNLVRGKPLVPLETMTSVLDSLAKPFRYKDKELKLNLFYILESLSKGDSDRIDQLLTRDYLPKVLRNIKSKHKQISNAALKIVGNIATGTDTHTQVLLSGDVLGKLMNVIGSKDSTTRQNALWVLGNIAAGSRLQITAVYDHSVARLGIQALTDPNEKVRMEASFMLYNTVKIGNSTHIETLITLGVISYLRPALLYPAVEYLFNVLTVIEHLLRQGKNDADAAGDGLNGVVLMLQEHDCIEPLEILCRCENERVRTKAHGIMKQYIDANPEETPEIEMSEQPREFLFS